MPSMPLALPFTEIDSVMLPGAPTTLCDEHRGSIATVTGLKSTGPCHPTELAPAAGSLDELKTC